MSRRGDRHRTHGLSASPEYVAWIGLRQRCGDPLHKGYAGYGGRGIKVCHRWQTSFLSFYADIGPRPSPRHSIDRIDNDGDYEPGNCRWATASEQRQNTRRYKQERGRMRFEAAARAAKNLGRLSPAQLRAARALLDWKQTELAERSGVFVNTIKAYERGTSDPKKSTELALMRVLRKAGVEFIEDDGIHGPGVRLREPQK